MSKPILFLSAATLDLKPWRDTLHGAFSRAGFQVLTHDHSLRSAPGDVRRLLAETVAEADCVVHLAGLAYGSHATEAFPADPSFECSWTQFEYYLAHSLGRDVIAFVCAPDLSQPFEEKGDTPAEQDHRTALQAAHRARVKDGSFHGTPLSHLPRTSNESVSSQHALLQAVAAAIGTLGRTDPAYDRVKDELSLLLTQLGRIEGKIDAVQGGVARIRHYGLKAFAILLLLLGGIYGGIHFLQQGQEKIIASNKGDPEQIRAAYQNSANRTYKEDLAAAEKLATSTQRQKAQEAAKSKHEARLARIDHHVADLIRLENDPATTLVMREMIRILSDPKENVDAALAYAEKQKAGIVEGIRSRNAAIDEAKHRQNRLELQSLLKAADLYSTKGDSTAARASYQEIIALEPDWPEALEAYAWFLCDSSEHSHVHGIKSHGLADAEAMFKFAERRKHLASEDPMALRIFAGANQQLAKCLVSRGQLNDATTAFNHLTTSLEIHEKLLSSFPESEIHTRDISVCLSMLADFLARRGQKGDVQIALGYFEKARGYAETLYINDPNSVSTASDFVSRLQALGSFIAFHGRSSDSGEALACYKRSIDIAQRLYADHPSSEIARTTLQNCLFSFGCFLALPHQNSDPDGVIPHLEKSLKIANDILTDTENSAHAARTVGINSVTLASLLENRGHPRDAKRINDHFLRGHEICKRLFDENPESYDDAGRFSLCLREFGIFLERRNYEEDAKRAHEYLEQSVQIADQIVVANPASANAFKGLMLSLDALADSHASRGRHGDSDKTLEYYDRCLSIAINLNRTNPDSFTNLSSLANWHFKLASFFEGRGDSEAKSLHRRKCYELMAPRIAEGMVFNGRMMAYFSGLKREFEQE